MTRCSSGLMLPSMPGPGSLVVIASYLRPEEAGMLLGLLESAGIPAVLRDDVLSGVNPFLQSAIGGVKLAVCAPDVERAEEIIRASGMFGAAGPQVLIEVPDDQWSCVSDPASPRDLPSRTASSRTWPPRLMLATLILLAMLLAYSLR